MNQKIEVKDERIDQQIAVSKENIKVEIVEAKPQTFTTIDINGVEEEVILNIKQAPVQTTLKDVDADISNLEIQLSQAEAQVVSLTAELAKKRTLKTDLEVVIQPAYDKLQVDLENKPVEKLPTEEPIIP